MTDELAQAKAALGAVFGLTEATAHRLVTRFAMDLRIEMPEAARILLAGVTATLATQADAATLAAAQGILTRRRYLMEPEASQRPAEIMARLEQLLLAEPPKGEAGSGG